MNPSSLTSHTDSGKNAKSWNVCCSYSPLESPCFLDIIVCMWDVSHTEMENTIYHLQDLDSVRILRILNTNTQHGPINTTHLSRKTDLNNTDVHSHLRKLGGWGLLEEKRYRTVMTKAPVFASIWIITRGIFWVSHLKNTQARYITKNCWVLASSFYLFFLLPKIIWGIKNISSGTTTFSLLNFFSAASSYLTLFFPGSGTVLSESLGKSARKLQESSKNPSLLQ